MSIHDCVRNAKVEEMQTLIATGADVDEVDKLKRTPLHMAG
jgi:ankyrin repeat protein